MTGSIYKSDFLILVIFFTVSRVLVYFSGIHFGFEALYEYWQYLDVQSLQHDLLRGLWYQHSQPPVFNMLLGICLKLGGHAAPFILQGLLLIISFVNAWLLLRLIQTMTSSRRLSLALSMIYLLSPATILFENELFYTSFISLLLLVAALALLHMERGRQALFTGMFFLALCLLALTRSMYHLVWLAVLSVFCCWYYRKKPLFKTVFAGAILSVCLVAAWYGKNAFLFGKFAASSWLGINFSRIVFHDETVTDSSSIAVIPPFYPISYYKKYISADYEKYRGLDDRDLLAEIKNDRFVNMNHAGYLAVSDRYLEACKAYIIAHPAAYLRNTGKAFIIYFTPASSYFKLEKNAARMVKYDLFAGFNLSHLAAAEANQKLLLAAAAIPIGLAYGIVLFMMIRRRNWNAVHIFIIVTILFSCIAGTLLEYGENMRFRYEIQPLFLVLVAQVISWRQHGMHSETHKTVS